MNFTTFYSALILSMGIVNATPSTQESETFVKSITQEITQILSQENEPRLEEEFSRILSSYFDIESIASFIMGSYWSHFTPEQKKEFIELFKTRLRKSYLKQLKSYKNMQINVQGHFGIGENLFKVTSKIILPQGNPVSIDWTVKQMGDSSKIIDLTVEGVSMKNVLRSEYYEFYQTSGGNAEQFLKKLRR